MGNKDQSNFNIWNDILYNSQDNTPGYKELIINLKNEFSKEYKRIKKDYSSIFYKESDEKVINEFIDDIPEKLNKLKLSIRPYRDRFFSCIIQMKKLIYWPAMNIISGLMKCLLKVGNMEKN